MSAANRTAISNPAAGLIVLDSTIGTTTYVNGSAQTGVSLIPLYYSGSAWVPFGSVLLAKFTATGSETDVSFGSTSSSGQIPGIFNHLKMRIVGRCSGSSSANLLVRINGLSTNSYNYTGIFDGEPGLGGNQSGNGLNGSFETASGGVTAIPGILGNSMQEPMLRDRDDLRFVV
jgi:hypothetical protein